MKTEISVSCSYRFPSPSQDQNLFLDHLISYVAIIQIRSNQVLLPPYSSFCYLLPTILAAPLVLRACQAISTTHKHTLQRKAPGIPTQILIFAFQPFAEQMWWALFTLLFSYCLGSKDATASLWSWVKDIPDHATKGITEWSTIHCKTTGFHTNLSHINFRDGGESDPGCNPAHTYREVSHMSKGGLASE